MILLYHNISKDPVLGEQPNQAPGLPVSCFAEQLDWLRRHRQIVALRDYVRLTDYGSKPVENLVAITFDDGLSSTFQRAYSLLEHWNVPATFFISTSHLNGGELLWFSYLYALCFDGPYGELKIGSETLRLNSSHQRKQSFKILRAIAREEGTPRAFVEKLLSYYPLPASCLAEYAGMTTDQLSMLSKSELLECGAHTISHPFLDRLSRREQLDEINQSRHQLETLTGKAVRYFAYPSGDYNAETVELLDRTGFEAAFATHQRRVNGNPRFEIVRLGMYSTSFTRFWLKVQGLVKPDLGMRMKTKLKTLWTNQRPLTVLPTRL